MRKFIIIILFIPFILSAEQDELFQTRGSAGYGASFINSAVNAYGVSTGGILTIFGHTADTVLWNPAGLCQIEDTQLQLSGSALSQDRMTGYISFAKLIGEDNDKALGFTLLNSSVGKIDAFNSYDEYLKKLDYLGNAFIITYSRPSDLIKIGLNVKILNEIMDKNYAYGGALDFGFIITPPLPIYLGININNLPGFVKWDTDKDIYQIGTGYSIGFGYKTSSDSMKFGMTFLKDYGDEEVNVNVGGEFALAPFISVRFGFYKGDFSGGVGLNMGFLTVDYAYYNEEFIDISESSQLISTTFHF